MEWLLIGGLVVLVLWVAILMMKEDAKKKYVESLEELKKDPNNPGFRQETLRLGRVYSNLMRDGKGQTVFDEVAIQNDILAATAGAAVAPQGVTRSVAEQVDMLAQLMREGVLSHDEFSRAKAVVIGNPRSQVEEATKLLRQLSALFREGVLSESEYNSKKWEVLSLRLIR